MRLPFWIVDVFAARPLEGNPAAVVFGGETLDEAAMQAIARETNLSETVFVLPPDRSGADYRVRIFTPRRELPFAGHPTVAAAFAWRRFRGRAEAALVQSCGAGLIPVACETHEGREIFVMTQPGPQVRATGLSPEDAAALIGCPRAALTDGPIEIVSTGVPWLLVGLSAREALAALRPNLVAIEAASAGLGADGVIAYAPGAPGSGCRAALRTFAPGQGIIEDPACGSGNGSVAIAMRRRGLVPAALDAWWAEQGAEIGRPSRIYLNVPADGRVARVGGAALLAMEGVLAL